MTIKNLFPKARPKKLNTATRRATMPIAEDYDTEEPNVRLSRAFIVVMLLHVVAVGGIFAFSSFKRSSPTIVETPEVASAPKPENLPAGSRIYLVREADTLGSIASAFGLTRQDLETANQPRDLSTIREGDKLIIPAKSTAQPVPLDVQKLLKLSKKSDPVQPVKEFTKAAPKPATPVASSVVATEKIYVVQKGDNPVGIAKKQGVKYADLLEANKITDPKKLQIGQKLIIPQK